MRLKQLKQSFGLDTLRGLLRFYTVLLVSLPLVLAAGFFFFFQRGQVIENELNGLRESLAKERSVVRSWIGERFADAQYLARLESTQLNDFTAMNRDFAIYKLTHAPVSAVVYVTPEGYTAVDSDGSPSVYVGDREYFHEAKAGREVLVSGILGRTSGKFICIFSSPVTRPDGSFGGLIFLSVQLDVLDVWLREATAGPDGGVMLCDNAGRILAPSAAVAAGGGPLTALVSQPVLAAGEAGALYRDAAGREMLGAAVTLDRGGWKLVREEPVSLALAGYRNQAMWVALGTLATICIASPLVLRLCRSLEEPLETLAGYARELRSKGYGETCSLAAPQRMPREIHDLFDAFSDMACQMRGHIDAIERLSIQDALTGLNNRRFLFSGGLKLLSAALRAGQPCACLMLDVDHFKRVNDTFGHQAGDQVLAHLGRLLAGAVRKSDLAARYGGEEFAVLLIGAGLAEGLELAERIRRAMAEQPSPAGERTLAVTVSVGVAEVRRSQAFGEADLDDLLARADAALYAAKAAGRNRVVAEQAVPPAA
ncbi:diguanylate cyclase [Desulfovibrio aerotolerans]|uniref:diguanylate cyclase n=1 Tax=Solidesulfovibrio aerotolerans TaxID=295255 RepID=A0A7C9IUK9_9BACT|nr:diguanylate cyclase [Solidesulfovibrio aerotolerans]MYL83760.1 diguanylate cyclase [Solidesulfovibrio aerotolerans]